MSFFHIIGDQLNIHQNEANSTPKSTGMIKQCFSKLFLTLKKKIK